MSDPSARWPEKEVGQVAGKLDEMLKENPDDVSALIIYARLGCARYERMPLHETAIYGTGEKGNPCSVKS